MTSGDVTLNRRDHRGILSALETIEKHHTKRLSDGKVIEPSFPHDDETHEDEVRDCPQCEVLESVFELRRLLAPIQESTGEEPKVVSITAEEARKLEVQANGGV
jgi:hypothetical protein